MPTVYTVEQVLADPIQLNSRLGTYTNFVNLLDLCGLAVPASMRADGAPSGITLLAPRRAATRALASIGRVFHADTGLPLGATGARSRRCAALPQRWRGGRDRAGGGRRASVRHAAQRRTARARRALHGGDHDDAPITGSMRSPAAMPPKPGMLRVARRRGPAIEVEVWALTRGGVRPLRRLRAAAAVDRQRAARRRQTAKGFLVEATAVDGARDISSFGGWRAYMAGKG